MKKAMCVLAMLGAFAAISQPTGKENKEEVEIEIQGKKIIIEADDPSKLIGVDLNKLIADVYKQAAEIEKKRAETLERIDRQLAAGDITREEAEELKEQANERAEDSGEMLEDVMESWGEAYEARWEAWAEAYETKMEAWEVEMEARTEAGEPVPPMPPLPPLPGMKPTPPPVVMDTDSNKTVIINEDGIIIKRKNGSKEPFALRFDQEDTDDEPENKKIHRTGAYLDIHFLGFNQQLVDGSSALPSTGPQALNFWRSTSFAIGFGWKSRLGNPFSKFYIKYGLEMSAHNFRLTDNHVLALSQDSLNPGVVFEERNNVTNFNKSKYYISYFNIPVMFQMDFSEVGETDESFTVGLGGYGGIRMVAKRELEYTTNDFRELEEKAYDDFFTTRYRYGLMAQVGWNAFKVTASYDLNPFFEENRGPNYNMFNLALGLTL